MKYAEERKLIEGVDYYINAQGLFVFTETYLQDRGYCCGNGCTHCPYIVRFPEETRTKHSN